VPKNHYQILGVTPDASSETIRTAHAERRSHFSAHPEISRMLDEAVATLVNDDVRARYDQWLKSAASSNASVAPDERPPPRRRLAYLLSLALVIAAGALLWRGKSSPPPTVIARPPITPPAATVAPASPAVNPTPLPAIATYVPTLPPSAPKSGPAGERAKFVRPPKKPGFDAFHLAWSVYMVIGAKGRGSGVMLEKDKLLTNCHVISGSYEARSVAIINSVTGETFYPEKVASLSEPDDVCLLEVPGAPDYLAEWGGSRDLETGAPTHTVSFPGNQGLTWTSGVLVKRESIKGLPVVLTTNHCPPGVSGGPLFDGEGRVIGITTGGRRYKMRSGETIQGECISIESETAREVMWRVMIPIAFGPFNYQGALGGGK